MSWTRQPSSEALASASGADARESSTPTSGFQPGPLLRRVKAMSAPIAGTSELSSPAQPAATVTPRQNSTTAAPVTEPNELSLRLRSAVDSVTVSVRRDVGNGETWQAHLTFTPTTFDDLAALGDEARGVLTEMLWKPPF